MVAIDPTMQPKINEITIDDLRKFKEYKDLSDEEASMIVESIKEFCRIVVDSVVSTNNYIDDEP
ncbi:MAG: hypothetical protein M0D57_08305 [Sphingobacteriales bacterium JAD_PAG50586_3]|jgi:hypothetical protein|nr:MAG: hypothetical protein M0D57_08305 [Sphingobacteriales bacterium JAD_PAG50586_3]